MQNICGVGINPNIHEEKHSFFFRGDRGSCSLTIFVHRAALSQELLPATTMYNTLYPTDLGSYHLGKLSQGSHVWIQKPELTVPFTALVESYNIFSRSLTTNEPEQPHRMQLRLLSQIRAMLQNTQWAFRLSREDAVCLELEINVTTNHRWRWAQGRVEGTDTF